MSRSTVVFSASDSTYGGSDCDHTEQPNNKTRRQAAQKRIVERQWPIRINEKTPAGEKRGPSISNAGRQCEVLVLFRFLAV